MMPLVPVNKTIYATFTSCIRDIYVCRKLCAFKTSVYYLKYWGMTDTSQFSIAEPPPPSIFSLKQKLFTLAESYNLSGWD